MNENDAARMTLPSRRLFLTRSTALTVGGSAALIAAGARAQETAKQEDRETGRGRGQQRDEFESIQKHEADHVAFLVQALGASARPKPSFQGLEQRTFAAFVKLSQTLENTGVGAYLGAAPFIDSMENVAAAGSIATIET